MDLFTILFDPMFNITDSSLGKVNHNFLVRRGLVLVLYDGHRGGGGMGRNKAEIAQWSAKLRSKFLRNSRSFSPSQAVDDVVYGLLVDCR